LEVVEVAGAPGMVRVEGIERDEEAPVALAAGSTIGAAGRDDEGGAGTPPGRLDVEPVVARRAGRPMDDARGGGDGMGAVAAPVLAGALDDDVGAGREVEAQGWGARQPGDGHWRDDPLGFAGQEVTEDGPRIANGCAEEGLDKGGDGIGAVGAAD